MLLIAYLGRTIKDELRDAVTRYFPYESLGARRNAMLDSPPLD